MPFTPFHFGPGLALKAILPRHVSFLAFAAANVTIDCETGYHMLRGEWPLHRALHTLPGAAVAGVVTIVVLVALRRRLARWFDADGADVAAGATSFEFSARAIAIGGALGSLSHPILDGIMHEDARPFAPFTSENPLLGSAYDVARLHAACFLCGVLGVCLLLLRMGWRRRRARKPE